MPQVDLTVSATSAEIKPKWSNIEVSLSGIDADDVLGQIGIEAIIGVLGEKSLLDAIGEDACIKHFGLKLHDDE